MQELECGEREGILLREDYERVCEEYRWRLNEQWGFDVKDSWWVPEDRPGSVLILCDLEYSLGMDDVRLMVDYGVSYDDFVEWWEYCLNCGFEDCKGAISAYSWFVRGLRPEDLQKVVGDR